MNKKKILIGEPNPTFIINILMEEEKILQKIFNDFRKNNQFYNTKEKKYFYKNFRK
jgi:hypothetical protein